MTQLRSAPLDLSPYMRKAAKLTILPTQNGRFGPLDGPFDISVECQDGGAAEVIATVVGFVSTVAAGVSHYNSKSLEDSSNLNSYAEECFEELKSEAPDAAAWLENLTVDCSRLPQAVKDHPIWRLNRAILRTLPSVDFVD